MAFAVLLARSHGAYIFLVFFKKLPQLKLDFLLEVLAILPGAKHHPGCPLSL